MFLHISFYINFCCVFCCCHDRILDVSYRWNKQSTLIISNYESKLNNLNHIIILWNNLNDSRTKWIITCNMCIHSSINTYVCVFKTVQCFNLIINNEPNVICLKIYVFILFFFFINFKFLALLLLSNKNCEMDFLYWKIMLIK